MTDRQPDVQGGGRPPRRRLAAVGAVVVAIAALLVIAVVALPGHPSPPSSDLATVNQMVQAGGVDYLQLNGSTLTVTTSTGDQVQAAGVTTDEFQALLDKAPAGLRPSAEVSQGGAPFNLMVGYAARIVVVALLTVAAISLIWIVRRRPLRPRFGRG